MNPLLLGRNLKRLRYSKLFPASNPAAESMTG